MGGTHSVDVMIAVNLYAVGKSMFSSRSLHLTGVLNSAHLNLSGVPSEGAGVVWEFFAGSAVWTKALSKRGYAYLIPIEITDCPHLDLLHYLFVEKCILVLRAKLVDAAHFGTPCSSLSIAMTPPWRIAEYPFGFPNLVGVAAAKVRVGNALSAVAAQLIGVCDECGVAVTDENSATSWHWKLPVIIALYARALAFEALLCYCAHGKLWRKKLESEETEFGSKDLLRSVQAAYHISLSEVQPCMREGGSLGLP
ncbi:unnamed protein product [Polarella glacialis]|uniref:Uncharacterized protein n=1 Tax=Polarella glacialis TaxID=89957 RepID=A0A813K5F1_POLGL|nr:unnamed protein product [Polarella glacialis]